MNQFGATDGTRQLNFDTLSDRIAEKCGQVSVGSSNVAGLLLGVIKSSELLSEKREDLIETFETLEQNQRKAADASDEARELSRQGSEKLSQSIGLIGTALSDISSLVELVSTLERHIIGFSAALEQVHHSTSQIDQIAESTGILALNASIEAARAGERGNSFSVVAAEVKGLAADTSRATAEISSTVEKFTGEAKDLIGSIELGAQTSEKARSSVGSIEKTVSDVVLVFDEVDRNNEQITRSTGAISGEVATARDVIEGFELASVNNAMDLGSAHAMVGELEVTASEMFDSVVKAGLSPQDSAMVDMALLNCARVRDVTLAAIEAGDLTAEAMFDTQYR